MALQESAVAKLTNVGPVSGYPLDVTDRESFATFLDKARTDGGGHIDVLINNAGVMPVGPFLQQSEQAIRSAVEVNFYGVLNGCQLVLPEMVARRRGHIVNIASMAGMTAVPGQVVYAGTKFAVVGLSTALADEFFPQGVDVSVVLPTFTDTELIAGTSDHVTLAISLDMADRSCSPGSSASIRSATSSALASSTARRSGRPMDSAWLTTISPPS